MNTSRKAKYEFSESGISVLREAEPILAKAELSTYDEM